MITGREVSTWLIRGLFIFRPGLFFFAAIPAKGQGRGA